MCKIFLELFAGHSFETKKWANILQLFKADHEEYIVQVEKLILSLAPHFKLVMLVSLSLSFFLIFQWFLFLFFKFLNDFHFFPL